MLTITRHFPAALMADVTQLDTSSFLHTHCNVSPTIQTAFHPEEEAPVDIQTESNDPTTLSPFSRSQWLWRALLLQYFNETTHKLIINPQPPNFRREVTKQQLIIMSLPPHI